MSVLILFLWIDMNNLFVILCKEMDWLFDDFGCVGDKGFVFGVGMLVIDVVEMEMVLEVIVELFGVGEKDIDVFVFDWLLIIKGEKLEEWEIDEKDWYISECSFGFFCCSMILFYVLVLDMVEVYMDNGVLIVVLLCLVDEDVGMLKIEVKWKID